MCNSEKQLTFCTCNQNEQEDHLQAKVQAFNVLGDKEEYNRQIYVFSLTRIIRKYTDKEKEKMLVLGEFMPRYHYDLNSEMTVRFVAEQLNTNVKFDFDYQPQHGDELYIYIAYKYVEIKGHPRPSLSGSIQFVYEEEKWHPGYVDSSDYQIGNLDKGEVRLEDELL